MAQIIITSNKLLIFNRSCEMNCPITVQFQGKKKKHTLDPRLKKKKERRKGIKKEQEEEKKIGEKIGKMGGKMNKRFSC